MTAKEFKDQFYTPIIYVWKRGEQYIYVGHSKHGYRRMLAEHTSFKLDEMEDTDIIEIYRFDNKEDCLRCERDMISRYHPLRNGTQGKGALKYYISGDGNDQY